MRWWFRAWRAWWKGEPRFLKGRGRWRGYVNVVNPSPMMLELWNGEKTLTYVEPYSRTYIAGDVGAIRVRSRCWPKQAGWANE
jgi:hypothetical protein